MSSDLYSVQQRSVRRAPENSSRLCPRGDPAAGCPSSLGCRSEEGTHWDGRGDALTAPHSPEKLSASLTFLVQPERQSLGHW